MTEIFSIGDVLVFNDDPVIRDRVRTFEMNFGSIEDEYLPLHIAELQRLEIHQYTDTNAPTLQVRNTRTKAICSGFWWRLKKKDVLFKYDPTQAGDTDEDV